MWSPLGGDGVPNERGDCGPSAPNPVRPVPPACLFRFNVLSLVYLLYLLLLPWFPGPADISGHAGRLLKALLGTSLLFLLAHFVFQICLYTLPALDQLLGPSCSSWEVLARHIGVTRLDLGDLPNSVRLVAPDVGILLVSSLCLCLCHRLVPKGSTAARRPESRQLPEQGEEQDVERRGGTAGGDTPLSTRLRVTAHWLLWAAGKGLAILLLALAGITLPSASSSIYYLLFVGLCTWWACHLPSSRAAFDALCVLVGLYAAAHLLCLYAYQAPFVQGVFPPPTIWARVFGFKDIILYSNCSRPNALQLNTDHPWPVYANPGILLLLYYTVATLLKLRRLDARRSAVPAQPPARDLVELESWPKDSDGVAEDTKPMLSSSTGKRSTENCTVHVMGDATPLGKPSPSAAPSLPCSGAEAHSSCSPGQHPGPAALRWELGAGMRCASPFLAPLCHGSGARHPRALRSGSQWAQPRGSVRRCPGVSRELRHGDGVRNRQVVECVWRTNAKECRECHGLMLPARGGSSGGFQRCPYAEL
ncbi:piezo-type mechanosensitive ion channel component 1-like [Meleagris gallopavo]|uniref:piezo-type mechanosensitive ion channel component 1-like n=1 Tax=Meleagris gallopavo TaxID=9103 RepID=UPI0012AB6420|nr:piezo-type mechanosensitive ion channel component 1-like [Meleagris gallopavo]